MDIPVELSITIVDDPIEFIKEETKSISPFPSFLLATQLIRSFEEGKYVQLIKPDMPNVISKNIEIDRDSIKINIHSIQGLSGKKLSSLLSSMDIIVLCYSITSSESLQILKKWNSVLSKHAPYVPILLAGDHKDQRDNALPGKKNQYIQTEEGELYSRNLSAYGYVEYSTVKYEGINELFSTAVKFALEGKERGLPNFSSNEMKVKKQLRDSLEQYSEAGEEENQKNIVKLIKKLSSKQKRFNIVDLRGANINDDQVSLLLPIIFENVKEPIGIDLSYNRLKKVPGSLLDEIKRIHWLSISGNQLHSLPPLLTEVEILHWKGNPLSLIPESFKKEEDWDRMKEYLNSVSENVTHWQEVKLLLVGQEGVGKTTLLNCLKNQKHKANTKVNLSTDGVEITRSLKLIDNSKISFNAWDLGGQEIFYPTHQFFLTNNSVYILVFNLLELNEGRMEYWMRLIKTLSHNSRKAPIFIVGTHADHPSLDESTLNSHLQKIANMFSQSSYRGLQTIHSVSCKSGLGIAELKQRIVSTVNESWFQSLISDSWRKLNDVISDKRESGKETATWHVYCEWANQCGVPDSELQVCTDFLKDNGSIIHFNDKKLSNSIVILNPQWLAKLMSCLVTFKHGWVKNGVLSLDNLKQHIFSSYPPDIHSQLIGILERFSVIFLSKSDPGLVIVPSLLPESLTPDQEKIYSSFWLDTCPDDMIEYGRIYCFPFLPLGFFEKIIVRIIHSKSIAVSILWREGLLASYENQYTKLKYNSASTKFEILVREPKNNIEKSNRILLLREIADSVDTLMECFYRMDCSVERLIPCSHCLTNKIHDNPVLFNYKQIIGSVTSSTKLQCGDKELNIKELAPDIAFADMIVIPFEQIKMGRKLGEGGFGAVYLGEYQGTPVAIKELLGNMEEEANIQFQAFQQECFVMSCLHHPNLVKLYGICTTPPLRMVLELIPCGDLFDFLHPKDEYGERGNIRKKEFTWKLRLRFALDIAKGMSYLQNFSPPIIHRDLRSPNIFLVSTNSTNEICAKVADFGLSRMVAPNLSGALGTWQWLAPEVFNANDLDKYDECSDRFSFGIICWEIATRQIPYEEYETNPKYSARKDDGSWNINTIALKQAIVNGLRPTFPSDEKIPPKFEELIKKCWASNPKKRPPFEHIIKELEKIINPKSDKSEKKRRGSIPTFFRFTNSPSLSPKKSTPKRKSNPEVNPMSLNLSDIPSTSETPKSESPLFSPRSIARRISGKSSKQ